MLCPADGEVHLWAAHLDEIECDRQQLQCLCQDERDRAARFRFERDKRRYERRRCLLRLLLGRYLAIDPACVGLRYGAQGKPELAESAALRFNLSHSDGHALFAFAPTELGVDLERIRAHTDIDAAGRLVFTATEKRYLEALPANERAHAFFRCWTRKEAYVKALGKGSSLPLASFEVLQTNVARCNEEAPGILLDVAAFPGFAGCVAIREPCGRPDLQRITCLPE